MIPVLLLGCTTTAPTPAEQVAPPAEVQAPTRDASYWVERTDVELDDLIQATCKTAAAANKPVLLSFSAPWCGDCRLVKKLEGQDPLRTELEHWDKVVVHVGRFDRHALLREGFGVQGIAHWAALTPDCDEPVVIWPRLAEGTFEPESGEPKTAADLAGWLQQARAKAE